MSKTKLSATTHQGGYINTQHNRRQSADDTEYLQTHGDENQTMDKSLSNTNVILRDVDINDFYDETFSDSIKNHDDALRRPYHEMKAGIKANQKANKAHKDDENWVKLPANQPDWWKAHAKDYGKDPNTNPPKNPKASKFIKSAKNYYETMKDAQTKDEQRVRDIKNSNKILQEAHDNNERLKEKLKDESPQKTKTAYEIILYLGQEKDWQENSNLIPRAEFVDMNKDFLKRFEERFPQMRVIGDYIHFDEAGAPHAQLDYVPVTNDGVGIHNSAMTHQVSRYGALEQMGYSQTRTVTKDGKTKKVKTDKGLKQFQKDVRAIWLEIAEEHGIEVIDANERDKDLPEDEKYHNEYNGSRGYVHHQDRIRTLNGQIDALEVENEQLNKIKGITRKEAKTASEELSGLNKSIETANNTLADVNGQITASEEALAIAQKKEAEAKKKADKAFNDEYQAKVDGFNKDKEQLESDKDNWEATKKGYRTYLNQKNKEIIDDLKVKTEKKVTDRVTTEVTDRLETANKTHLKAYEKESDTKYRKQYEKLSKELSGAVYGIVEGINTFKTNAQAKINDLLRQKKAEEAQKAVTDFDEINKKGQEAQGNDKITPKNVKKVRKNMRETAEKVETDFDLTGLTEYVNHEDVIDEVTDPDTHSFDNLENDKTLKSGIKGISFK